MIDAVRVEGRGRWNRSAFSLIELLVVMGVIILLMTSAAIGLNSILRSSRMDQAGRVLVDEINLARQIAAAQNVSVELQFLSQPRPGSASNQFWMLQAGIPDKTNANAPLVPLRGKTLLPDGIALAPEGALSPILGAAGGNGTASITIRPNGILEPRAGLSFNTPWCVTLVPERKLGSAIADLDDFITVQIDPITARPTLYRP